MIILHIGINISHKDKRDKRIDWFGIGRILLFFKDFLLRKHNFGKFNLEAILFAVELFVYFDLGGACDLICVLSIRDGLCGVRSARNVRGLI